MKVCRSQRIILGPPGTGKTTRLLGLITEKLGQGVPPEQVAYFSFTRKAVGEAMERAAEQFGASRNSFPHFRTIHSEVFAVGGHNKNEVMGKEHYREIGEAIGVRFDGGKIDETTGMPMGDAEGDLHLFLDNLARARRVPLRQQWEESNIADLDYRALERTVGAVTRYRESNGLVDFTSMLERYLNGGPPIDVQVAFIDEAQEYGEDQSEISLRRRISLGKRALLRFAIPFVPLTDFTTHKKQFFSWLADHITIKQTKVGKLLPEVHRGVLTGS